MVKRCTVCTQELPLSAYAKRHGGLQSACRPCNAAWKRLHHVRIRAQILEAYGNKCVCCGEDREPFLVIDHIEGGGLAHRRRVGIDGIYRDLRNLGYPKGYQVLCANCNMAKERGVCPHQTMQLRRIG